MLNPRRTSNRSGFTLVELVIALVILMVAVLGTAQMSARLSRTGAEAELSAKAQQAAEDRISEARMELRYSALDTLFSALESDIPGLPGFTRTTEVTHTRRTLAGGGIEDFRTILVTVSGPFLGSPIMRALIIAAP